MGNPKASKEGDLEGGLTQKVPSRLWEDIKDEWDSRGSFHTSIDIVAEEIARKNSLKGFV